MQQQWAAIDNWQNIQRGKRGLDTTEGELGKSLGYGTDSSYGSGSKKAKSASSYRIPLSAGGTISSAKVSIKNTTPYKVKYAKVSKPIVKITKSAV